MKKLSIVIILSLGMAATGYCTNQPQQLGSAKASDFAIDWVNAKTITQFDALTADTTNQLISCSNCTMSPICKSSGTTAAGQWTILQSTGVGVVPLHCQ